MQILFTSFLIGFGVFLLAATLVSVFYIQPYIQSHGERSACAMWQIALWRDYQTACRIAKLHGKKPGFLIWFERLSVIALALFIAGVLTQWI
jgi:hypothetical protein